MITNVYMHIHWKRERERERERERKRERASERASERARVGGRKGGREERERQTVRVNAWRERACSRLSNMEPLPPFTASLKPKQLSARDTPAPKKALSPKPSGEVSSGCWGLELKNRPSFAGKVPRLHSKGSAPRVRR